MTYYKQIDTFRFFAAFAVLITHWLHFIPVVERLKLGLIGVDFFFVISGFLISYQLFQLREKIKDSQIAYGKALGYFIVRRALRIFPLYYLVLILATLFNNNELRDAFFYNLSYTSNFYFIKVQHWPATFSHFWSLSVEEHFYLIWPCIILLLMKRFTPVVILFIAITAVSFRYFTLSDKADYFATYIHTISCLDLFMYGTILAYFMKYYKDRFFDFFAKKRVKYFTVTGILISYSVLVYVDQPTYTWVFSRAVFGVFSAGLIGLLTIGFTGRAGGIFENKWLVKGGKLSYGIYLLHNFIPGLLLEIKKLELHFIMEFIIYLTATILISLLLHKFIETPVRKLGARFKVN